eukprot:3126787-Pyramimonas_sp.AAC.1
MTPDPRPRDLSLDPAFMDRILSTSGSASGAAGALPTPYSLLPTPFSLVLCHYYPLGCVSPARRRPLSSCPLALAPGICSLVSCDWLAAEPPQAQAAQRGVTLSLAAGGDEAHRP